MLIFPILATDDAHFIAHGAQNIVTAQQAKEVTERPEEGFGFTRFHADQFFAATVPFCSIPRTQVELRERIMVSPSNE